MTTPEAAISALQFGASVRNDPLLSLLPSSSTGHHPYHSTYFGQHFDANHVHDGMDGNNNNKTMAGFRADSGSSGNPSQQSAAGGNSMAMFNYNMNFNEANSSSFLQKPPLISCRNASTGPVRFCVIAVDRLFDYAAETQFESTTAADDSENKKKIPLSSIEVRVRVELRAYGHLLAPEFITCSTLKGNGEFSDNGCWVTFPIGFGEVPADTVACCTVIASSGDIVGGSTFNIFDNSGAIVSGGPWSYPLVKGVAASGAAESSTLVSPMQSRWDSASVLVKNGKLPGAKWMDDAAISHIKRVQSALQQQGSNHHSDLDGNKNSSNSSPSPNRGKNDNNNNNTHSHFSHFWSESQEVQAVREELAQHQLRLEQEKINQQQFSEEMKRSSTSVSSPSGALAINSPGSISSPNQHNNTHQAAAAAGAAASQVNHNSGKQHLLLYTAYSPMPVCLRLSFPTVSGNSKAVLVRTSTLQDGSDALQWFSANASEAATLHYPANPTAFHPFKDAFVNAAASMSLESKIPDEAGLCAKKAAILSRSSNFLYDPNAKPNAEQRRMFEEIAKTPPIQLGGVPEHHVALLWQFRHFIVREPQLLLPFVKSIDWNDEKDRTEAEKIVRKWKQITVADALILLSKPFRGIKSLRQVAVNRLKSENDAQTGLVLLQLVQCIRYDDPDSLDLFNFLMDRAKQCWSICNFLFWYIRVECDLEDESDKLKKDAAAAAAKKSGAKNQQQQQQKQQETNNNGDQFIPVRYNRLIKLLVQKLEQYKPQYKKRIDGQELLITVLTKLYTSVALKGIDRPQRIEKAKKLIDNKDCGIAQLFDPQNAVTHGFVFLPSHPHIAVKGIISDGLLLFKSAKQPMLLPFVVEHGENIREHADIVGSGKEREKTLQQVSDTSVKGLEEDRPKLPVGAQQATLLSSSSSASMNSVATANNNNNNTSTFAADQLRSSASISFPAADNNTNNLEEAQARLRAGTFAVFNDELPSDTANTRGSASVHDNLEASMRTSTTFHNIQQQQPNPHQSSSASSAISSTAPSTTHNNNNNNITNTSNTATQSQPSVRSTASTTAATGFLDKEKKEAEKIGDVFKVIFKNGDDVRQDQLVIQVVEFADLLLRQNGLQLHLTPYRVLATSPMQGFVECVPEVETLQDVQKITVNEYLWRMIKDKPNPKELHRAQQEKFLKSCAGYCVITYLLGVGDRHLENLLVTKDGRLLHIDFGYILGKDPKPLPPPMKLNKEMVEAMGGVEGRDFAAFRVHSFTAYSVLRRHHTLFLSLLLLMVDASMPNFDDDGKVDPLVNLRGVQEKLRLDLSDEADARAFYAKIIQESLSARFTVLWDVIHVMAQNARN